LKCEKVEKKRWKSIIRSLRNFTAGYRTSLGNFFLVAGPGPAYVYWSFSNFGCEAAQGFMLCDLFFFCFFQGLEKQVWLVLALATWPFPPISRSRRIRSAHRPNQSKPVRRLEVAPVEGTFFMTQRFRFRQGLGNGGAINGYERTVHGRGSSVVGMSAQRSPLPRADGASDEHKKRYWGATISMSPENIYCNLFRDAPWRPAQ